MSGPGGVLPPGIPLRLPSADAGGALRPGQIFAATVREAGGTLFLQTADARIPLPSTGIPLEAGVPVTVEVLEAGPELHLRIVPRQAGEPQAPPSAADRVADLVAGVLETLGRGPAALTGAVNPQVAADLLAPCLPQRPEAVQRLLALFLARGRLGADLRHLAQTIEQAAAAGALSRDEAAELSALIARFLVTQPADLQRALREAADNAARAIEARLALALAAGDVEDLLERLHGDLAVQLARLRDHPALAEYLRARGGRRAFLEAIDRVLERFSGGRLQDLHALDRPYLFFELAFDPDGPVTHGQVHVVGEGRPGRLDLDPDNVTVVLDLSTVHLGDLSITLRLLDGRCDCRFGVTRDEVVQAIQDAAGELAGSLAEAGYHGAHVHAVRWEGDRLTAVAGLLRRFSGIDVEA